MLKLCRNPKEPAAAFKQLFPEELIAIAEENPNVIAFDADLANASGLRTFADRFPEPVGGLLPLLRRADALVIFDVVAEDQIRAALVVAPSPQLLAAAHGVDPAAVGEQDGAGLPRFARLLAEVR